MEGQIDFPITWHYKIITFADQPVKARIEACLKELKLDLPVTAGNLSKNGSYQSYRVSVLFNNKEDMDRVSAALAKVEGIKFML